MSGAKEFSVDMAYEAFRLALGGKPRRWTPTQVVLWLCLVWDIRPSVLETLIRKSV